MATPFDDKHIVDAFFTDQANTTIEVLYQEDSDNTKTTAVYVPADPSHYLMRALIERGFNHEKIAENTIRRKKLESALWTQAYKRYATEEVKVIKAEYQRKLDEVIATTTDKVVDVFAAVMQHNTNEDMLFKAKLAIFDMPEIKAIKARDRKQAIRTAKTFIQLFAALDAALK